SGESGQPSTVVLRSGCSLLHTSSSTPIAMNPADEHPERSAAATEATGLNPQPQMLGVPAVAGTQRTSVSTDAGSSGTRDRLLGSSTGNRDVPVTSAAATGGHAAAHSDHHVPAAPAVIEAVHVEVADEVDAELELLLQTDPQSGLTDSEAGERLERFGRNEMPERRTSPILKFLSYFLGAISYLLEAACVLSAVFADWVDFGILLFVLISNACIGYFEEARAESALDALKNTLALKSRVWRNGKLVEVDSVLLVPGD
ncbi:plasma membrane H+-ATPase, partial [Cladochytrium tenue]